MKRLIILVLALITTVWATIVIVKPDRKIEATYTKEFDTELVTSVDILTLGDLLYHRTFLRDPSEEAFYEGFKYMDKYFQEADIVIGNYETTTNPKREYAGYPMFNTPPTAIKAIKKSGIDILNTNNNHSLDSGLEGLKSTLQHIRQEGIKTVGTQLPGEPKRIDLRENGIRIGLLSFNYGYNGLEGRLTKEEFDVYVTKIDETKIEQAIKESKDFGNDFTLVIMHWGNEYQTEPSSFQKNLAKKISDWGADVIIGSHPHVVQPTEMIGDTLVIYSMGNYVSDQRLESLNMIETERGLVAGFTLEKNHSKNETKITNKKAIPTWVYKRKVGHPVYYEVVPAQDYLDGKLNLKLSSDNSNRVKLTQDIIGNRVSPGLSN